MRIRVVLSATALAAIAVLGGAGAAAADGHDDGNVVISKQTWSPNTITDNFNRSFNSASSFGDMVLD
ncbi:hypothetical protein AB0D04_29885 [Streptomyces sp. NPDC048483]|uniref:hypothetical protein n=1 Tax=Streptomyces sp. NPDC048483 TaxID=3154927 RepID=UPI00343EEB86